MQRDALWRRFDQLFTPGQRLLDLGCGTGEDALHLAERGISIHGVDVSPAMIEIAEYRTADEDRVTLETMSLERLDRIENGPYDGAISSFGPINCVRDLDALAVSLGALIRPGGIAALCLMNRHCLWETALYPLTAALHRKAASEEEWSDTLAEDEDFQAFYPSVDDVRAAFAPGFEFVAAPGVGVFLPPSYLEPSAVRYGRTTRLLAAMDRATAHLPVFRAFAETRLIILRRLTFST